jgi:hypothetical protein
MKLAPFTKFGSTVLLPVVTWTGGHTRADEPPGETWDSTLWVESAEDWYALLAPELHGKTVRVVAREDFLAAREATP